MTNSKTVRGRTEMNDRTKIEKEFNRKRLAQSSQPFSYDPVLI
ncbi:hypothetical protein KP78_19740 [Jeotgalibacillus soli]|uniref:Uncharacterized protein n=1 Tax=Jeotgalibacillus soli TaxID=889306 RepID=A0A0C2R5U4_9BACL|nr:hypothetical protein KP78_19740 [Jeotgalibacillus soli]